MYGLVNENKRYKYPTKYELFIAGKNCDLFKGVKYPSVLLEKTMETFSTTSQGRYIREIAYSLLALDFAEDIYLKKLSEIYIDSWDEITKSDFMPFIQCRDSKYVATPDAVNFSTYYFATRKWQSLLLKKITSYGYFARYIDVINIVQKIIQKYLHENQFNLSTLKNLIGPFDSRVKGSGPDFIQETFKTWGFVIDVFNIEREKLKYYNLDEKLKYLSEHTGFLTDGTKAYRIIRNLKKAWFNIKREIPSKIRIVNFMRIVNLETWRRKFEEAISTTFRRLRLLYLFNKLYTHRKVEDIFKDNILKEITDQFDGFNEEDILGDMLFLESTGIKIDVMTNYRCPSFTQFLVEKIIKEEGIHAFLEEMTRVEIENLFYKNILSIYQEVDINNLAVKPSRKFDIQNFEKYLPKGKIMENIKK